MTELAGRRVGRAFMFAAVALPALLFAIHSWLDREQSIKNARTEVRNKAALLQEHAIDLFATHDLANRLVNERLGALSWSEIAASEDIYRFLVALHENFSQIDSFWLIDPEGLLRSTSARFPAPTVDLSDRQYFRKLQSGAPEPVIGRPVRGRVTDDVAINVGQRRRSGDDTFNGVVLTSASIYSLVNFWRQAAIRPGDVALLLREDGMLLAREPAIGEKLLTWQPDREIVSVLEHGGEQQDKIVPAIDDQSRFYAVREIPGSPIRIVYGMSRQNALGVWQQAVWRNGVLFCLATAILALFACRTLAHAAAETEARSRWQGAARDLRTEANRRALAEGRLAQVLTRTVYDQESERRRIARELHDRLGSRGRLGILGMRERLAMVGGTLEIESAPGKGTTVFARVPLPFTGNIVPCS